AAIQEDPSNDDFVYFGEQQVSNLPLHERFHRMYGYHDGNTPLNEGDKRAVTNRPDTEGLVTPSIVEQNNAYFQYEIDWNPADIDNLEVGSPGTFIVDKVPGPNQQERWYQVRIPLQDWVRKFGNIDNFQNVSYIRIWFSGYSKPFTVRFATFELVGSQWRNADNVDQLQASTAVLNISSVNIEENSRRRPIPYRLPEGVIRARNRAQQRQTIANEQSVVLEARDIGPDEIKMIKRVYPGGLNMVNYSNLRMFVHGEGYDAREDAELVMRFGTDLINNYYEYRQPVTPSDPNFPYSDKPLQDLTDAERDLEAEQVWIYEENSVNILLRHFNELKQLRDQQNIDPATLFERSDLLQGAPPGATIAIRGNPSLDRVGEIGMGIRNPFDPADPGSGTPSLDAEFWLNELRVSGFDNRRGWAANAKAELQLADFASVNLNVNRETDGFGSLNSGLGQRRFSDILAYDANTTVNLHKFIPDRYGWNIPLTLSTRRSSSTPRFLPNQGDVTISEFKEAVNARTDIVDVEKERVINEKIRESQTVSESYSINLTNVGKRDSESGLARYMLDNTTLNFVYNNTDRHNPEYRFQNGWNYSGSIRYSINFRTTRLIQPFGFMSDIPVLDLLSGFRMGYTPSSITASTGIDRDYQERKRRILPGQQEIPLQQSHLFSYNTIFGFTYNFTPTIKTSFRTRTIFDLSAEGIEPSTGVTGADSASFSVTPTFKVLNNLVTDTLSSRRSNYEEAYTAGWQPRLDRIAFLDWVDYSANYGGGFQWRNSPRGSGLGATITNNFNLTQSLNFGIRELLGKMEWYRDLVENGRSDRQARSDTAEAGGDGFGRIARKGLLTVLSIQSFDISYSNTRRNQQAGYAGESQLYNMFKSGGDDFSPPFSYRTGITSDIGRNQLIDNPNINQAIQIPAHNTLNNDLTLTSRLLPFRNISLDLTWNTQWDSRKTRSITLEPTQTSSTVRTQNGEISSSVWAFGKGYASFFRRQLSTAFGDVNALNDTLSDQSGNNDGRTVLGKRSLQEDFRKAYLGGGSGSIGERNFTPFPLPGWRLTWTGLEKIIPFAGEIMTRATLTHSYIGNYRLGWIFNSDTSPLNPLSLGAFTVENRRPEFEPTAITIEKNFNPLIGLNITWESNLRTNIQYSSSRITSLALSNTTVTERLSRGIKFSFSYSVRDFKLPFFPRVRNAVDFTINTSFLEDTEQKFVLSSDLENALVVGHQNIVKDPDIYEFNPNPVTGQSRINGSAIIGYQFSQFVKANFEYSYGKLIPKSSGVFERTDHDLRFNIVVSIRSS
ncbi:MAG: cell surface protein SprA, partial [Balneolaceae bacterium]|nr:cell surface protein SprA [Balneolaceae bacterium]